MGSTGVLPGGAPVPEPERVAMIRYTIVDEPETCAGFAEPVRATLAALDDEVRAQIAACDPAECTALIDQARDRITALEPARLEPRRGLAGLFDSRNKRLKAFRAAYEASAEATTGVSAGLGARAAALTARDEALDALWTRTRDAIVDLDAQIAAARSWLAERDATPSDVARTPDPTDAPLDAHATVDEADSPPPAPDDVPSDSAETDPPVPETSSVEAVVTEPVPASDPAVEPSGDETDAEPVNVAEAVLPEPAVEPADAPTPPSDAPHPLRARLAELSDLRARAVANLPRLRAAQNADCRAPGALGSVSESLETWRTDWQAVLGLDGRKPKKVRPNPARLDEARAALTTRLTAAEREILAIRDRRAELASRST